MKNKGNSIHYHIMLIPGCILVFLFTLVPILLSVMAFQDYNPRLGVWESKWIGFDNFKYLFMFPEIKQVLFNTIFMAVIKIVGNLVIALIFSLLLNEIRWGWVKRPIQTLVYLPHFISWVLLAAIFFDLLSIDGAVNSIIKMFGAEPVMFMASNKYFPWIAIITDIWKEFGFNAIVFISALAGVNQVLYEAADIDGATRLQKVIYVTLPAISSTIVVLATLGLGNIMNANFDQIFNMYNPLVYKTGDIIDTYVYRLGLENLQYSLATAAGLFKSAISFILVVISYKLARKFADYKIF